MNMTYGDIYTIRIGLDALLLASITILYIIAESKNVFRWDFFGIPCFVLILLLADVYCIVADMKFHIQWLFKVSLYLVFGMFATVLILIVFQKFQEKMSIRFSRCSSPNDKLFESRHDGALND